jgi:hypothetical protein
MVLLPETLFVNNPVSGAEFLRAMPAVFILDSVQWADGWLYTFECRKKPTQKCIATSLPTELSPR